MLEIFEQSLPTSRRYLQINHYYDTPDFLLYHNGDTLRIRQRKEGLAMEYKISKLTSGNLQSCLEYKTSITCLPHRIVLEKMFPNYSGNSYILYDYIGSLMTERIDYKLNSGIISFDKNWCLGQLDYEIEFELMAATPPLKLDMLLQKKVLSQLSSISPSDGHFNKYTRFIKVLEALNTKQCPHDDCI